MLGRSHGAERSGRKHREQQAHKQQRPGKLAVAVIAVKPGRAQQARAHEGSKKNARPRLYPLQRQRSQREQQQIAEQRCLMIFMGVAQHGRQQPAQQGQSRQQFGVRDDRHPRRGRRHQHHRHTCDDCGKQMIELK